MCSHRCLANGSLAATHTSGEAKDSDMGGELAGARLAINGHAVIWCPKRVLHPGVDFGGLGEAGQAGVASTVREQLDVVAEGAEGLVGAVVPRRKVARAGPSDGLAEAARTEVREAIRGVAGRLP